MPPSSRRRAVVDPDDDYLEYETFGRSDASAATPAPAPDIGDDDYEELVVAAAPQAPARAQARAQADGHQAPAPQHSVSKARAQQQLTPAPSRPHRDARLIAAFSSLEEDFFAAGEALSELPDDAGADDFADLDALARRRPARASLWRRVFS